MLYKLLPVDFSTGKRPLRRQNLRVAVGSTMLTLLKDFRLLADTLRLVRDFAPVADSLSRLPAPAGN